MTLLELKAEARRQGYRLQKIPDYDCSCYLPYPNERHRHANGTWKCVDRYEPSGHERKYDCYHMPCTYCRKKREESDA